MLRYLLVGVSDIFARVLVDEVERVAGEDDLLAGSQTALDEEGVAVACDIPNAHRSAYFLSPVPLPIPVLPARWRVRRTGHLPDEVAAQVLVLGRHGGRNVLRSELLNAIEGGR